MTLRNLIAALATLLALAAAAFLALSPAQAIPPPDDLELIFSVDDLDGVIEPGQTIKVNAAVRFPGQYGLPHNMKFRDFTVSSSFGWEASTGRSITIPSGNQAPGSPTWGNHGIVMGAERIRPTNDAGVRLPDKSYGIVFAMDRRTAVVRTLRNTLIIYDTWNKRQVPIYDTSNQRQVLEFPTPAGYTSSFGASERGFPPAGAPGAGEWDIDRYYHGRAIAVWHETETLAWVFLGEPNWAGTDGNAVHLGRLHVYTLDWSTAPPTFTATGTTLSPPLAEAGNHLIHVPSGYTNDYSRYWAAYGSAVAISADGSTLAVGAPRIHHTGAVYVYTRPDGAGRDWSDITYADGVKVTTAPVGHYGQSEATSTMPFSGQTCDAVCIRQRAAPFAKFGWRTVALSADGRVLAVGASGKRHNSAATTPAPWGGQGGGAKTKGGEAYVFVAPEGGWQAAPDVVTGKTVMTAKTDAATDYPDYSRATHITPGPNRRITEPTHVLQIVPWHELGANTFFAQFIAISRDGTTVVGSTSSNPGQNSDPGDGAAAVFQVDSPDQWGTVTAQRPNPWPGALITGLSGWGGTGWCGIAFNGPGDYLFLSQCGWGSNNPQDSGGVRIVPRPADGRWVGGTAGAVGELTTDPVGRRTGAAYGMLVYSLTDERLSVGALGIKIIDHSCCFSHAHSPGDTYFSDAGCYERRDAEGDVLTHCPLALGDAATIVVPPGEPDGRITISGEITLYMTPGRADEAGPYDDFANAKTVTGTPLTLRISSGSELAEAKLDFAVDDRGTTTSSDDRPYPSSLSSGERTVLRLQLLNEAGDSAAAADIASIIATATRGSLSSNIRDEGNARITDGCLGGGGDACQIHPALLTGDPEQARLFTFNDRTPPPGYRADDILLTLEHTGTGGIADVNVRVIAKDGMSLSPETVRVNLVGAPTALSIAEPTAGVLGVGTPDADDEGGDVDNRDLLTLAVTATDASGLSVPAPTGNFLARVTGPDGRRVSDGVEIEWPLGGAESPTLTLAGARQVRVDVDRAAGAGLANGEYTLFVRAGSLTAEQTFTVSGAAAALTLSEPSEPPALNGQFSVTATVVDAAGDPVPDGTEVDWEARTLVVLGDATTLVQTAADTRTTQGQASSTWLVVGSGNASLRATADGATELLVVNVPNPAAVAAQQPARLIDSLSATTPGAPASWLGAGTVMAADLLPALDGVNTLLLWQYGNWLRYGVVDGRVVPGSYNFQVRQGDVLWLTE